MSLKHHANALSLGVEIDDEGAIVPSSIVVTSSQVRVAFSLTYDEVDEMLEEGIAYHEEWQLGALLSAAKKRRQFRKRNGSMEATIPHPLPTANLHVKHDNYQSDDLVVTNTVQSRNAEVNITSGNRPTGDEVTSYDPPASGSRILVEEMMILANEAMGQWQELEEDSEKNKGFIENSLRLPFRYQPRPGRLSRDLCVSVSSSHL